MVLDNSLKQQLAQYLELLENPIVLNASLDDSENSKKLNEFLNEIAELSDKVSLTNENLKFTPSFEINRESEKSGISFAGLPLGHEFESLVLALLQVGGRTPKISEEQIQRIKDIDERLDFETIVSLTCHNCPDVVQALNIMSVLNPNISNTMIEGGTFQEYVDQKDIMAVPTVFLNETEFTGGKTSLDQILDKLGSKKSTKEFEDLDIFDVLVIGGGPSAATAAIYTSRKGLKTAMVYDEFGGQVVETLSIENITGLKYTEGPKYMENVKDHINQYDIRKFEGYRVLSVEKEDLVKVNLDNDASIEAKTVIVATGARWRSLGIPGEEEFKNKGVAFCVHCDGPLFKDKSVSVIGGGNSGVEAAIDLSAIASEVHLIEFNESLKADQVLQDKLRDLDNIEIITNAQTSSIDGDSKVSSLSYIDRETKETKTIDTNGVFIQIGLVPNTEFIKDVVEVNKFGEIVIDNEGSTNIEGIYASGDCTNISFKQIIIAEGSGANSALGVNNYLMRNN